MVILYIIIYLFFFTSINYELLLFNNLKSLLLFSYIPLLFASIHTPIKKIIIPMYESCTII